MLTLRVEWPNSVEWGGFWLIFDSLDDWLSKAFVSHLLRAIISVLNFKDG